MLLTKSILIEWKNYLIEKYAPSTVNSMLIAVNGYLRFFSWHDLSMKLLKIQKPLFSDENKELTREEYARLVMTASKRSNARLSLILQTICATGIRVSELKFITIEAVQTGRTEIREPLNNSLYPVSTQCISRHLRLVKVISAQNSHYLSTFLLHFPKKGRLPLCQIVESFLPAMASAYKLAQANMAYSRFSFFFRPRYTVFL